MEERKQYQLMYTLLKKKFFISTLFRQASTIEEMWYFETIVWEWDEKERKTRGAILEMEDSGMFEDMAIENHMKLVKQFNDQLQAS